MLRVYVDFLCYACVAILNTTRHNGNPCQVEWPTSLLLDLWRHNISSRANHAFYWFFVDALNKTRIHKSTRLWTIVKIIWTTQATMVMTKAIAGGGLKTMTRMHIEPSRHKRHPQSSFAGTAENFGQKGSKAIDWNGVLLLSRRTNFTNENNLRAHGVT
jgi:hypothetical protein